MDRNEDASGTSTSVELNRLGSCEVCAADTTKYTCPRCEVKTCSLTCNKIHKSELECNGQRDRTKFVPLNKFTNLDLLSDYRLLEEITSKIQTSRKNKLISGRRDLPVFLQRLRTEAFKRKIRLKFLPKDFARHKNNRTRFYLQSKTINWQIEWVFVNSDNLTLIDTDVSENIPLKKVIDKYLKLQDDKILSEKLQYYQAVGHSGIRLFLRAEEKSAGKFYELDADLSLKESLRKKTVIEYPVIHVMLRSHGDDYEVINSDYEEDTQQKNLLFNSDISDDEED